MIIDAALLVAFVVILLKADRYWPMWVAALQLLTMGIHAVRWFDPSLLPAAYHHLVVWLGYPVLGGIAVGTWRHDRRERADPMPGVTPG